MFDGEVVMVVPLLFVLYGGVKVVGVVCLVGSLYVSFCFVFDFFFFIFLISEL